ncbi:sarcoplasmic calcium-binding protein [Lingula anatina]|uniref:Sarcoplasmic calcium-binding protein n=1 Tax=Lingula anatina TaxID=7574 RepID=A0A1S3ILP2_LINAN|nr:sarcoplasmic calcium-binding protein [Lingula anatina]|eukprot:XP_013399003.1 sarcoplasmic calcium-binding protein [Lingula anatina]
MLAMSNIALRSWGLVRDIKSSRRLAKFVRLTLRIRNVLQTKAHCFQPVRRLTTGTPHFGKLPADLPYVTGSEHWKRKVRSVFKRFDLNTDGYVTGEDYVAFGKRMADFRNLDGEKAKQIIDKCLHTWAGVAGNKNKITEDDYLQSIHSLTIQCCFRPQLYHGFVSAEFGMMDIDGDGLASKDEHVAFFHGMKVPMQFSKEMFVEMDTNKDGLITFDEFAEGFLDFWFTEDPNNKYNHFYGPLVD